MSPAGTGDNHLFKLVADVIEFVDLCADMLGLRDRLSPDAAAIGTILFRYRQQMLNFTK